MKRFSTLPAAALLALAGTVCANEPAERPAAAALLEACREGLPFNETEATLSGRLVVFRTRGFPTQENKFVLHINWGAEPAVATCSLYDAKGQNLLERVEMTRPRMGDAVIKRFAGNPLREQEPPSLSSRIAGTDLLWLDLTMDFLWWPDPVYDDNPKTDRTWRGYACDVIMVAPPKPIPGCSGVRIWIEKKTGFLVRVEKLDLSGKPVRYFWVQKVKEFSKDEWMIRLVKAEAAGSRVQTHLLVDALNDEEFEDKAEDD